MIHSSTNDPPMTPDSMIHVPTHPIPSMFQLICSKRSNSFAPACSRASQHTGRSSSQPQEAPVTARRLKAWWNKHVHGDMESAHFAHKTSSFGIHVFYSFLRGEGSIAAFSRGVHLIKPKLDRLYRRISTLESKKGGRSK